MGLALACSCSSVNPADVQPCPSQEASCELALQLPPPQKNKVGGSCMVAIPGKSAENPAGRSPRAARLTREDPDAEGQGTATPPLVALQEMKLLLQR